MQLRKKTAKLDIPRNMNLGKQAKDKVTGFSGTVTDYIEHLTGCNQYGLIPKYDGSGKYPDTVMISEADLKFNDYKEHPKNTNLGKHAVDGITGFEGTIIGYAQTPGQCDRYCIMPDCEPDKTNKYPKGTWLDDNRIKINDKKKKKKVDTKKTPGACCPALP